ncbi:DUF3857 domain-containing protein [Limibacter armeniacum]|uniref:DUF3857 domain-containing protein n=1 Tax=Limibacter armeniacum TaxID=466084 RepID=UPI002FE5B6C0
MKLKFLLLSIPILLLFQLTYAKDPKYPLRSIPDSLQKGADAVIRELQMEVELTEKGKYILREKKVITIFNSKMADMAADAFYYDDDIKILSLEAATYDASGKEVKRLKKRDIRDIAYFDSYTLFQDSRLQVADLSWGYYPYTVEFICESEVDGYLTFPRWVGASSEEKVSTQKASYHVTVPTGTELKYKSSAVTPEVEISEKGLTTEYKWEVNGWKAIKKFEDYVSVTEQIPFVTVVPTEFIYGGYEGKTDSWSAIGEWSYNLNKGTDVLPEEAIAEIKKLTEGIENPRQVAKKVYEYVQGRTRYVSVQLGIGGHKPIDANKVHTTGYGDCKALSNYTYSLLKEVGIKSHYAIIRGGRNEPSIDPDFPADMFNHVILCVPFEQDTVWLECTSQTNPFGYIGNFTDDRHALLVTDEGGKLVKTRAYAAEENKQTYVADFHVNADGKGEAVLHYKSAGEQYDKFEALQRQKEKEQKEFFQSYLDLPSMLITDMKYNDQPSELPVIEGEVRFTSNNLAKKSTNRLFITPNQLNRSSGKYRNVKRRKFDFEIGTSFVDYDSVTWNLPEGYELEEPHVDIEYKCEMGSYKASFKVEKNQLTYTRTFQINKGRYSAELFNNYMTFRRTVIGFDKSELVFVKREGQSTEDL